MKKVILAMALFSTPLVAFSSIAESELSDFSGQVPAHVEANPADSGKSTLSTEEIISQLAYTAQDARNSAGDRAKALRQLSLYPNQNALVAVARGLQDAEPVIRQAAVVGAKPYNLENRWRMVAPLLNDEVQTVRLFAATNLVRDYGNMNPQQQKSLEPAVSELIAYLSGKEDENSSRLLADVYRWHKEWQQAETVYRQLFDRGLEDAELWMNYADNFRSQGLDKKAISVLDKGIELHPEAAELYYSKSLALVRFKNKQLAAVEMETAATLAEDNSYYWYLSGVLQEEFNIDKSTQSFEKAYLISGAPEQLYAVCDIYVRYGHAKSEQCLAELGQVAPDYVIKELRSKMVVAQ